MAGSFLVRASVVIILFVAALLGLALLWMPAATRAPAARPQEAPVEPQASEPAVPAAPAADPEAPAGPTPAQPEAEPYPAEVAGKLAHPSSPEYAAMLAARFDADPPEVDGALERDVARRVAAHMPAGSRLDAIECRQMLCRVRSLHPDRPTYDAFISAGLSDSNPDTRLWPGQVWVAVPGETKSGEVGARVASVIYLQRDPNPPPR